VYETIKLRNNTVYFLKQHVDRLIQSAAIIDLSHEYTHERIIKHITDLVTRNGEANCNIKILLIGGKTAQEALFVILPLAPLYPDRKLYTRGATANTVNYERYLPNAKTLNMLRSYMYYTQAVKLGHYDTLFLDAANNILEGSRTNFFTIKGTTIVTPPKNTVLEGVTRQTVIAVAKKIGYSVEEKEIPLASLHQYDGAFLTSTSTNILPLTQIDTNAFRVIPEAIKSLMKQYDSFLHDSKGIFTE
jgi:branched-subunit amino acid aminotransferase/4-amino-4-deoxychorismate lyase